MHTPSKQKWLERNRAPRVQISYDVETAGAIEKKELPLVVGILADLSGMPEKVVPLVERRFVEIDRDVFDKVLSNVGPRLDVSRLTMQPVAGLELGGVISFNKIDDFDPEHIVKSIPGLNELLETRNELRDLMAKLDGNAKLEGRLTEIFVDKDGRDVEAAAREASLKELMGPANVTPPAPEPSPEPNPNPVDPDNPTT